MKTYVTLFCLFMFPIIAFSKPKILIYCSEGSPSTFNPQLATDGTTFNASSRTVYDRLVEFRYGETTIVPGLARSWKVSKDGKTYTFYLRKNIFFHTTSYFHPTRPLQADDVIFSFNRQRNKKNPYHFVSGGTYEYFQSMGMKQLIRKIIKVDPYTVRFELTHPEAPFLANLAMDFASILSKEYADFLLKKHQKEKLDQFPIGTGPFVFQTYRKDQLIRFRANTHYFKGKPHLDGLIFVITPDASVRFQKLKRGECHFVAYPAPQDLNAMKANPNIKVLQQPGLNIFYLSMNVQKKPLKNRRVRLAINYALNKKKYIEAIYKGRAQIATAPIPPTMWAYPKHLLKYPYRPKKAKALLKQAGYGKGLKLTLWTLPVSRPYCPDGKKLGELMQADLAQIGIQVKLITYDWPTYLSRSKKGEHDLLQLGWTGDNGDPDNFLNILLSCQAIKSGSNNSRWCSKRFDRWIEQAKKTTSFSKRKALYLKAQKLFKKEAPWVTLVHATVFRAMRKSVHGYRISPFGSDRFYPVDLK